MGYFKSFAYFDGLLSESEIKEIATNKSISITGLPSVLSALNPIWSPNEDKIAFINTNRLF